jgi:hypothetical protein
MFTVVLLLAIAWFALAIVVRVLALVGKDGAVHCATRRTNQATTYRRRLERNLHTHC